MRYTAALTGLLAVSGVGARSTSTSSHIDGEIVERLNGVPEGWSEVGAPSPNHKLFFRIAVPSVSGIQLQLHISVFFQIGFRAWFDFSPVPIAFLGCVETDVHGPLPFPGKQWAQAGIWDYARLYGSVMIACVRQSLSLCKLHTFRKHTLKKLRRINMIRKIVTSLKERSWKCLPPVTINMADT